MRSKNGRFSERLEKILDSDRTSSFVKLLEAHPEKITKSLVKKCAEFGAKNCLLLLLQGKLCNPPPSLYDDDASDGATALAYAAHSCPDPQIIDLLLNRCNAYPQVNVSCTIASVHGSPIDFTLLYLSYLPHLYYWARGDSLIKLIILLCMSDTKPILESVRLLAQRTDSINKIAWTFVEHGALKQFAALLLVSREKVMAQFDTGLTIPECLTTEINLLSEGDISSEQVDYKNMLIDAQKLLDVFERAGDALSLYCSLMKLQKNVTIERTVTDVCEVLKSYGVFVSINDLRLENLVKGFWSGRMDVSKLCGIGSRTSERALHVTPTGKYTRQYEFGSLPQLKPIWMSEFSLSPQLRWMSTQACYARKFSKPLEHVHGNHSLNPFAQITMKFIKKGLRYL